MLMLDTQAKDAGLAAWVDEAEEGWTNDVLSPAQDILTNEENSAFLDDLSGYVEEALRGRLAGLNAVSILYDAACLMHGGDHVETDRGDDGYILTVVGKKNEPIAVLPRDEWAILYRLLDGMFETANRSARVK